MRFLTDADHARMKVEREEMEAAVAEKIAGMGLENFGLHELTMIRDGFQAQADACDEYIANAVSRLRSMDSSWTEIGKTLGVSKQAAQKRFGSG